MYMFQDAHQGQSKFIEGVMQVQALAESESIRRRDLPNTKNFIRMLRN